MKIIGVIIYLLLVKENLRFYLIFKSDHFF